MNRDEPVQEVLDFLLQMVIIATTLDDLRRQLEDLKRIEQ